MRDGWNLRVSPFLLPSCFFLLPQLPPTLFLRQSLTLLPMLECSGVISVHCNLCLWSSSDSCALASQVAGIMGVRSHAQLIFVFLVERGFHHVGQVALKLLTSSDLSGLASKSGWITGVSHCAWPRAAAFYRATLHYVMMLLSNI